ncbi:hypothetical protein D3C81_684590 [compost metagenome]
MLAVVFDHFQRPAELSGAGCIRVIVGREWAQGITQFGVLLQPAQRLVAMLDEGIAQGGIVAVADDLLEVGAHCLGGVLGAGVTGLVGAVQPHRAARNRRGAAKAFGLFHHQHLQPAAGRGGGSGKTTGTAAQHNQVEAVVCVLQSRHGFRSPTV